VNYKRKSRRRFFLLMRSRTPAISSEFRVGGLNPTTPPLGTPLRIACWITKARIQTCTHSIPTATVVTRTHLSITLYVHCLSWKVLILATRSVKEYLLGNFGLRRKVWKPPFESNRNVDWVWWLDSKEVWSHHDTCLLWDRGLNIPLS